MTMIAYLSLLRSQHDILFFEFWIGGLKIFGDVVDDGNFAFPIETAYRLLATTAFKASIPRITELRRCNRLIFSF